MHSVITKFAATDGLLFLVACLGYLGSPWGSWIEKFYFNAIGITAVAGFVLILIGVWTG